MDSSVLQKKLPSTNSSDIQQLSLVEPSLAITVRPRPFVSDTSILDVHLSLVRKSDSHHKPDITGGLRAYCKPIDKEKAEISEVVAHSHKGGAIAQIDEGSSSDNEEFEDMDVVVVPSTD